MQSRQRMVTLLLLLNWLLLVIVSAWTSVLQGNVLWWLNLNWSGWLSDLGGVAHLSTLPGGSVLILWLMLSVGFSTLYLLIKSSPAEPAIPAEAPARKQLMTNADLMESRPELKEKILKLRQSLDKL